jgi:ABC-type nitrate/sulfonate/bicarbonate transport system ATPase subunit
VFVTNDIDEAIHLGQPVLVPIPEQFGELRGHVYRLIQLAKRGHRPGSDT